MSDILRRFRGRTGHFARSDKAPITSSNGAEALPQLTTRSHHAPSRKPGDGKQLILISAGITCVGIIALVGFYLLREGTPTTDKAVVEGNTYPVSSRIDGAIAGILVSNRQYVRAGDLLAEIDKRDLEARLTAARADLVQAKTMCPKLRRSFRRLKQNSRQQNRGCFIAKNNSLKRSAIINTSQDFEPKKALRPCSSRE